MSNLHDKMSKDMQLRGFSPRTQYRYLMNLKSFILGKPIEQEENLDPDGIKGAPLKMILIILKEKVEIVWKLIL